MYSFTGKGKRIRGGTEMTQEPYKIEMIRPPGPDRWHSLLVKLGVIALAYVVVSMTVGLILGIVMVVSLVSGSDEAPTPPSEPVPVPTETWNFD
jgi:hypothetical protein